MIKQIKNLLSRKGGKARFKNPDTFKYPLFKKFQKEMIGIYGEDLYRVKGVCGRKVMLEISDTKIIRISKTFLEFC